MTVQTLYSRGVITIILFQETRSKVDKDREAEVDREALLDMFIELASLDQERIVSTKVLSQ